jgi:uncharacterized protein (TIGR03083 family)
MSRDSSVTATFSHESYCEQLEAEIERLVRLIEKADPRLKVPACPRWAITWLAHHTGSIHRWATGLVLGRARRMRRIADIDDWQRGLTPAEQSDWLRAGAGPLLAVLGSANPDEPMWAWGQDPTGSVLVPTNGPRDRGSTGQTRSWRSAGSRPSSRASRQMA